MSSWLKRKDAEFESHDHAGLGHLAGLRNNTASSWWKDPMMTKLHLILILISLAQVTNGYDISLMNNLQSLDTWNKDLGYPDSSWLGIIGFMMDIGGVLGSLWASPISDRFGRRWGLAVGGTFVVIGGLLQGLAHSKAQYIVGRVAAGVGNITGAVGASSLNTELAHPRTRPFITAYYNTLWYIGAIIAAWLCYGLRIHIPNSSWQWRIAALLIAFWGLVSIVLSRTVPESPRWLIAKGREEEAAAWLYKWHANGDTSDELVAAEILEIKLQLETEETQRRVSKSWRECFATPGDRWRMFISFGFGVIISWTGQSIVSYYNTQILNQAGITGTLQQLGINGGLTIFDFFTACLGAFLTGRMGRRPLLLASYGGMTFFHVIVTALSARYSQTNNAKFGYAVIAFIWCESGFYNIALNPLCFTYVVEIMSFSTRTKGMALNLFTQEVNSIITRYCNPVGLANLGWKYYIVYLVIYIFEIIFVYVYFPETNGRTLEEIAEIFDGTQIANQVLQEMEGGGRTGHLGSVIVEGEKAVSDEGVAGEEKNVAYVK